MDGITRQRGNSYSSAAIAHTTRPVEEIKEEEDSGNHSSKIEKAKTRLDLPTKSIDDIDVDVAGDAGMKIVDNNLSINEFDVKTKEGFKELMRF